MTMIGPFPARDLIRQWLKAGYVDEGIFHDTAEGTPQGGVISPLLANIALHGMEDALGVRRDAQGGLRTPRAVVRYADDFVVFCESREDAEATLGVLRDWLAQRGLSLSEEKTRIVHLTDGFDFLGFTIRRYKTPHTRTGYRLHVTPSKEAVKAIRARLHDEWRRMNGRPVGAVITRLNPLIRGWANDVRITKATATCTALDHWMYRKQRHWAKRQHAKRTSGWLTRRYWGRLNPRSNNRWVCGDKRTGAYLLLVAWFSIDRHALVRGTASPDDPRLRAYWAARSAVKAKLLRPGERKIATHQNYRCRVCGESLFTDEEIQKHHIQPRSRGGPDTYANVELTHLYCHQQMHGRPGETVAAPPYEPTRRWLGSWLA